MDNEYSADFVRYYVERSEDGSSYKDLWRLNKEYDDIDAKLERQHGMKLESLDLNLKGDGKDKTLDTTGARHATREEYKGRADKIARKHGFTGKSYDEHLEKQKVQEAQSKSDKPDDKEPPPPSPSGGKNIKPKELSQAEKREAFLQQMRDAGGGLTKGKERER